MTLTEFLLARIAEDETVAIEVRDSHDPLTWAASDYPDTGAWGMGAGDGPSGYYSVVIDPDRVLADCDAKRRIVALEPTETPDDLDGFTREWELGQAAALGSVLSLLALPYADHPDYRKEWRP